VIEKKFKNQILVGEDIAEIEYPPLKCEKKYRLVIVRKNLSVQKGEKALLHEIKYFFYINNWFNKACRNQKKHRLKSAAYRFLYRGRFLYVLHN
jgi:hypothetical protein